MLPTARSASTMARNASPSPQKSGRGNTNTNTDGHDGNYEGPLCPLRDGRGKEPLVAAGPPALHAHPSTENSDYRSNHEDASITPITEQKLSRETFLSTLATTAGAALAWGAIARYGNAVGRDGKRKEALEGSQGTVFGEVTGSVYVWWDKFTMS